MAKYICCIHKEIKFSNLKSRNGYISISCLICFVLTIQILSLVSILTLQNTYLLKSNIQNVFDLSCINQAKYMITHNNKIRVCHLKDDVIQNMEVEIDSVLVNLTDKDTYVECVYVSDNRDVCLKVYYDTKGIQGIAYTYE
jgi:hypothetical protein